MKQHLSAWIAVAGASCVVVDHSVAVDSCPADEVRRIVAEGFESTRAGSCPDEGGSFVVAVMRLDGRTPEEARIRGLSAIASVLGVSVGAREEAGQAERIVGDKVEFDSFFKSSTVTSIDQALAGVQGRGLAKGERDVFAIFVLSERTIDSSTRVASAASRKPDGPVTVEATGLAEIRDGRIDSAKKAATNAALRQSVEMVVGATVVARSALNEDEESVEMRSQMANTSLGLVDSYKVLRESQEGDYFSVTVQATVVPKKLLDSFESIMRSMGDPAFYIDAANDQVVEDALTEFFRKKGLRLTNQRPDAVYIIKAESSYSEVEDPADATGGTRGMRGQLRLDIVDAKSGESLGGDLRTDGRATSFVGRDPERQKELVCMTILNRNGERLHRQLQEFIERQMAGRRIRVAIIGIAPMQDPQVRGRVMDELTEVPFIEDVQLARSSGTRVEFDVLLLGRADRLAEDLIGAIGKAVPGVQIELRDQTPNQVLVGAR